MASRKPARNPAKNIGENRLSMQIPKESQAGGEHRHRKWLLGIAWRVIWRWRHQRGMRRHGVIWRVAARELAGDQRRANEMAAGMAGVTSTAKYRYNGALSG
jgi:hypothetical protein